jgi:excisionase family DNA binding protein
MSEKELLSAAEAAEKLTIAKRTLLRWARSGKIECVRISTKVVLFTTEAIDRFVDARTFEVESPAVNNRSAGRKMTSPKPMRKGGDNRISGELWNDLRKEVRQWQ